MKSTTAALYFRVSKTDESQDPDNQRIPLLKMAESLEVEVVKEYVDLASGGSTTRPKFQQMLKDAQKHEFDLILVWSLDRFSREGISRTLSYLEKLKRAHVGLRSLQESHGFNFEDTHLTESDQISKLLALLTLASY